MKDTFIGPGTPCWECGAVYGFHEAIRSRSEQRRKAKMIAIWKFPIDVVGEGGLDAPEGSRFLSFQEQNGTLCVWMLVDLQQTHKVKYYYKVWGTGHPHKEGDIDEYLYAGSCQQGPMVWHLFLDQELLKRKI